MRVHQNVIHDPADGRLVMVKGFAAAPGWDKKLACGVESFRNNIIFANLAPLREYLPLVCA